MRLQDIAINNLRRRKGKMLFLILGILMGIATVVSLFSLTSAMSAQMNKEMEEAGGKVLILPQNESMSFSFGGITVASGVTYDVKEMPSSLVNVLGEKSEELNINFISPKKLYGVEVDGRQMLIVGIDFPQELKLKPWLRVKGNVPQKEREIVLGASLADVLQKSAGDTLVIKDQEFMVTSVLEETGSQEDGIIMGKLIDVQELTGNNTLSLMEVSLKNTPEFDVMVQEIKDLLPDVKVTPVKEAMESRKEVIERFEGFATLVSILMLLVAVLIVTTTMMGSVNERVREIGIFRAIGFRKKHVISIILMEAGLTCLIGGVAGYLTGIIVARLAVPFMDQGNLIISWNPLLGLGMMVLSLLIALGASWIPAVKAANLDPSEALREF